MTLPTLEDDLVFAVHHELKRKEVLIPHLDAVLSAMDADPHETILIGPFVTEPVNAFLNPEIATTEKVKITPHLSRLGRPRKGAFIYCWLDLEGRGHTLGASWPCGRGA